MAAVFFWQPEVAKIANEIIAGNTIFIGVIEQEAISPTTISPLLSPYAQSPIRQICEEPCQHYEGAHDEEETVPVLT